MTFDAVLQILYLLIGMGAIGFFAFIVVKNVFPDASVLAAHQRLGIETADRHYKHKVLEILAPFFQALVPRIQQIKMPVYRQNLKRNFVAAGLSDQFTPDEFVGLKVCSAFLTLVFGFLFSLNIGSMIGFQGTITLLFIGYFIPDFGVWDIKTKRQQEIQRELPNVIDLLCLSVEAGLDFMAGIARVVSFSKDGPLKEEFNQMFKELQIGTVRADALRNMADRVQLPELSSFASVLVQTDQMGVSMGPVLRAQADVLRNGRFQRAERAGAKAVSKALIPMIVCILPAIVIVILGPVICDIFYNQQWLRTMFGK